MVYDFVIKCNQDYIHWDKLRYKEIPNKTNPKYIWVLIKIFRSQQFKPIKFNDWVFKYLLLNDAQRKLHLMDKGTAGHLETGLESVNTGGRGRYIISSLMEEAIASSQLEGAATTRKIAKEILRLKRKPINYSERMIVNGYETMQKMTKMKDRTLTPEIILKLHKNITKDTLEDKNDEGRFRDNNEIFVGDSLEYGKIYHTPPDYKKINGLMEDFCEFASNDEGEFIHPVVKGIILHFLIGYIHPFSDGNGRTARTIFYWYVLSRGYWLFEYMSVSRIILRSKTKYGLAYLYTETDENDLTYFINYNLDSIDEALHDMEAYISKKQKEYSEALDLIQGINDINSRQAEILKNFMRRHEKNFVINEIMTTYNVAYDTARNDLLHLTELGYLEKTKIKNKFVFKLSKHDISS
ncbi:transposase [Methanosarcinales archaeon]|nr:MAG: transposase [Methanosarcinales archaeon]